MGLLSWLRRDRDDDLVDLDDRSPELGVKYADLMLMNEIMKSGADLSEPRHVVFYIYAPSDATGRAIAEQVRSAGFAAQVQEPHEEFPGEWPVVCETHAALTPEFVRDTVDFFESLADQHRANYDGWEAAV